MEQRYEKQEAGEIVVQNRFVKWLDNYWYHYKWHTIVALFFLFVGTVCFTQCSTAQNASDLRVAYIGGFSPTEEERHNILSVLESVSPDKNTEGAGSVVALNNFTYFTEEEINLLSTDDEGNIHTPTKNQLLQNNKNNLDQFRNYSKTGDSAIWLVSEQVYKTQLDQIALMPLAELYAEGEIPESAYDAYAIRLKDTDLYRVYGALASLPEDTLIVMPRALIIGSSSNPETYAYFKAMFYAIVDYRASTIE